MIVARGGRFWTLEDGYGTMKKKILTGSKANFRIQSLQRSSVHCGSLVIQIVLSPVEISLLPR